jgi:hypothetical protein
MSSYELDPATPHSSKPFAVTIPEAGTNYKYDGSACCTVDEEETLVGLDVVFNMKRTGVCCCTSVSNSTVRTRNIELSDTHYDVSSSSTLTCAWCLLGCAGGHRFLTGRWLTGSIMTIFFVLAVGLLIPGWLLFGKNQKDWFGLAIGVVGSIILITLAVFWICDLSRLKRWDQYVLSFR